MSDDLISRKVLFEEIQSFQCSITGLRAGKGVLAYAADEYRKSILQIIEDQPTAFDKEKMIELIKVLSSGIILNTNISDDYAEGYVKAAKDMIAIVEKGRVE